jgi:selenocysteine-specific elongation factor
MRVIGTAGHVDHGKSTLVHALTGIDPDRLKEEKEREMTIDLGFAWLRLPSGIEASVVDVPGHEDFIRNMLAGVGGVDLALFVVAADEGVMPQTREHLAIVDLLQIRDGVVALTKCDLIDDPEWLDLVREQVREALAGSVLDHAAIIPVSARTGQGVPELLAELDRLLQKPPPRRETGRPRLPVDRVFIMPGFGTVVTGTLIDGRLQTGQEVEILPRGLKARIRGLQTHKSRIDVAVPPSRTAVNLTGVSTDQLQRGDVLTTPGWLRPTSLLDARLRLVRDALRPLPHDSTVDFFSGTAQGQARVRVLDAREVAPGEERWVQFNLSAAIPLVKGDRYIIRQISPSLTLGGGCVVDPLPQRRHRRFQPDVIQRLEQLERGTPEEVLLQELERAQPSEVSDLIGRSSLGAERAAQALTTLLAEGGVLSLAPSGNVGAAALPGSAAYVMSVSGWESLRDRIAAFAGEYHQRYPLRAGCPREELKSRLDLAPRAFNEAVAKAVAQGVAAETDSVVSLADHHVVMSSAQERQVATLLRAFRQNPHSPPSFAESEAIVGADVLAALIEQGKLVRVSETVLFSEAAYQTMTQAVVSHLQREGRITLAQVRDLFNTSRKYAQALLEHLDERRVTKRVGDERVLR